ncbi:tail fiber domain-containing protein [Hymenobacter edaphi]|uniref:Peptidase S74 domain-containing protein n=1 Tax=Hymenobacter edaphi TaxID=2211146 RepID=A0A328BG86_9BACT|nr:tail fiber domain-containing protein [Hymenobacter edaphi]RAK65695.1 hypothetical protein DLM85_13295 [Hymenobacter edaphi]
MHHRSSPLRHLFLLLGLLAFAAATRAQSVGVGTATPNAKAALDIVSTDKGVLVPRLTQAQRTGIAAPVPVGLLVYQTDGTQPGFWYYEAAAGWTALSGGGSTGDNLGDHVATTNLNLNGNKLVDGTTARAIRSGLDLSPAGLLTLGAARTSPDSTTGQGVRLPDLDQDFMLTSRRFRGKTNPLNVSGAGERLMWLSYYSAFRAGGVTGTRWDYPNVGSYSVAFGLDNQAGSDYSVAFGYNNRIRAGEGTFAMGYDNEVVQGYWGVMMGRENAYRGYHGLVGGYQSKVQTSTFLYVPSLAFGYSSQARSSQGSCYALGYYARTGGYYGCFVLADYSPVQNNDPNRQQDSLVSTSYNQFSARFAGGYRLFTTAATTASQGTAVGVKLDAGSNAWSIISDSTKKERVVLADGNLFLARINGLRLGSWNYRGQSPDTMRHYGPMAQDFYAAFGHDGVGRSGNPTSINQADFDGVNLIAIQALYRRVLLLEAANARQQQLLQAGAPAPRATTAELAELRRQNAALQSRAAQADADHAALLTLQAQVARLLSEGAQARK